MKRSQPSAHNLSFLIYPAAWQWWCLNTENEKGHVAHWGSSFSCILFSQDTYNHYLNDPRVSWVHNFALWGLLTFIIQQLNVSHRPAWIYYCFTYYYSSNLPIWSNRHTVNSGIAFKVALHFHSLSLDRALFWCVNLFLKYLPISQFTFVLSGSS